MKHKIILCSILILQTILVQADPILVAVLMVKNEAPVIEKTLQPLIDAGITDYLIYDTGSTDDTIPITQDFFINNNITNFVIEQGPWIDFSASRNQALQLAEQYFPNATFMLMLDAEWILHNGSDLLKFCQEHKDHREILYCLKLTGTNLNLYHSRLIRTKSQVTFVGKIHEIPNVLPQVKVPEHIYFDFSPTDYGSKKTQTRWLHDKDVLLLQLQENPNDSRAVFLLAQTCYALGQLQEAISWFIHRSNMSGYDEENFLTLYNLAQIYQSLGAEEEMITTYLKAFCLRSHRAEPLIKLAEYYYNKKSYHLCYLFARHAATMPYPDQDISLVDVMLYKFVRYGLLSATAYMFGDFKLGKQATLKGLANFPDEPCLKNNLQYYQDTLDIP